MNVRFGVAGFPPNFMKSEFKKNRDNIFSWLHDLGLDWIELQNTYGVKMPDEQAYRYRSLAEKYNIGISIHAPYYISFASKKSDVVTRSKDRMIQCFNLADKLGASRIIFHPGFPPGKSMDERIFGTEQVIRALNDLQKYCPKGVLVYPETAGKCNQIGSISEIIHICKEVEYARPCIDLAHVHGFEGGKLNSVDSIKNVLKLVKSEIGDKFLNSAHFHMYPVEYDHNGEKMHKAFDDYCEWEKDEIYHPSAYNFVEAIREFDFDAVVVCEARDTQDIGASLMKNLLFR